MCVDVDDTTGMFLVLFVVFVLFFQAEGGRRDLVRSRGLGDVYKRQLRRSGYPRLRLDAAAGLASQKRQPGLFAGRAAARLSLIHI